MQGTEKPSDDELIDEFDLRDLGATGPTSPVDAFRGLAIDLGLRPQAAVIGLLVTVALVAAAWWWWHDPPASAAETALPLASVPQVDPSVTATAVLDVVAHAAGGVVQPGIYTLPPGARVADLIDAAGGAVADADLDRVNLAAPLGDGAQVHVPLVGESTAAPPIGGAGVTEGDTALVDLNIADAAELESLPGVGPATSAAIIQYREETGPFATVEDLLSVSGIGDAKLEALREFVTV